MSDLINLKIQSLVYGGYGISRLPDGKAVFVPFVLPGERVEARILEEKKGHALAELIKVIEPHPQRIIPRCRHFGICGGCHYQHIPYQLQLEIKQAIFIEQLQRIAGIDVPVIKGIMPSILEWGYRNALQFSLSKDGKLCFADFYHNQPFEVKECHLPLAEINKFWPQIEFESGTQMQRVELRQNQEGDLLLVLRGADNDLPETAAEAPVSIVHLGAKDQVVIAGDDHLIMHLMDKEFKVSAGAFFQTNIESASKLVEEIRSTVFQSKCKTVMDIYSGVGLFSAFIAENVEEVLSIESSPAACEDFVENLDLFNNVSLYQGKAENILPMISEIPNCVIVDPPRSGFKKEAAHALMKKSPKLLIYVSCNPSTFARDAKNLVAAGYHLEASTLLDMFPQTFHIESINIFRK